MKFGKKLRLLARPQWQAHYVNYKLLKQFIHAAKQKTTPGQAVDIPSSAAATGSGDADSDGPEEISRVDSMKQFPELADADTDAVRQVFLKRAKAEIRRAARHVTAKLRQYRSKLEEASRDAAEVLGDLAIDQDAWAADADASSGFLQSPARPDPLGGSGLRPRGHHRVQMLGSSSGRPQPVLPGSMKVEDSSSSSSASSAGQAPAEAPAPLAGVVLASSVPLQPLDAKGRVLRGEQTMAGGSRVLPSTMHLPTASVPLAVDLTEVLAVSSRGRGLASMAGTDTPMSDRTATDAAGSPVAVHAHVHAGAKRGRDDGQPMPAPPTSGAAAAAAEYASPPKKARLTSIGSGNGATKPQAAMSGSGGNEKADSEAGGSVAGDQLEDDEEDDDDVPEKTPRAVQNRLLALSDQLEDLRAFMELNLTAATKIGKKFDKQILRLIQRKPLGSSPQHGAAHGGGRHNSRSGGHMGASMASSSSSGGAAAAGGGAAATGGSGADDPRHAERTPDGLDRTRAELDRTAKTSALGDKQGIQELADECEGLIRSFPARKTALPSAMRQAPLQPVGTVQRLDITSLPVGKVSGMFVAMGSDPLQQPIAVPVMVARGASEGPVVMITSALHGNEVNGIAVIHKLFARLEATQLAGTIIGVPVANPLGYVRHQRGYSDGTDLNRVFPGRKDGTAAQQFAHHFCRRILGARRDGGPIPDYLLDLHTASFGRVNSLYVRADMREPVARRMALLQNPQIIVHSRGGDGTLRGAASALGIASITVEIGNPQRFHSSFVELARQGVVNLLSHLGMVRLPQRPSTRRPIPCSRSFWIFTRTGGILSVKPAVSGWVRKGEVIAEIRDLFGVLVDRYVAPCDGVCVGKADNPVCQSGDRVVHIGVVEAGEGEGSAFAAKTDDGHP